MSQAVDALSTPSMCVPSSDHSEAQDTALLARPPQTLAGFAAKLRAALADDASDRGAARLRAAVEEGLPVLEGAPSPARRNGEGFCRSPAPSAPLPA